MPSPHEERTRTQDHKRHRPRRFHPAPGADQQPPGNLLRCRHAAHRPQILEPPLHNRIPALPHRIFKKGTVENNRCPAEEKCMAAIHPNAHPHAADFLLMLASLFANADRLSLHAICQAVTSFPSVTFFAAALLGMVLMTVFAFILNSADPRANWIEQLTNGAAQTAFFIGL